MTLNVGRTMELADRLQNELQGMRRKRFLGPRKTMELCMLMMEAVLHLRELAHGLELLARQMPRDPQKQVKEGADDGHLNG